MINYLFLFNLLGVMSQHNSKTYSYTNTPTLINSHTISYSPTVANQTKPIYTNTVNPFLQEYKIQPYTTSLYEKVAIKKINYSDIKFENFIDKSEESKENTTETNKTNDINITINLNKIVLLIHILNISYIIIILIKKFKDLYN